MTVIAIQTDGMKYIEGVIAEGAIHPKVNYTGDKKNFSKFKLMNKLISLTFMLLSKQCT